MVAPELGEQRGKMQTERLAGQTQLPLLQIAADAAADIFRRRRPLPGRDTDLLQIGGKLQTLGPFPLGAPVHLQVAQGALRAQRLEHFTGLVRQRRQRIHRMGNRCQLQLIGADAPFGLHLIGFMLMFDTHHHRPPTPLVVGQAQLFNNEAVARVGVTEVCGKAQIAELLRGVACMTGLDAGQVQAGHRALQAALPVQPELTAALEFGKAPVTQQLLRQPLRPVALRQTQVELRRRLLPVLQVRPHLELQGQGLAIRQGYPGIQVQAPSRVQGKAQIGQAQRLRVRALNDQLAVEQSQVLDHAQRRQQLLRLQRRPGLTAGQALQLPVTRGILRHT